MPDKKRTAELNQLIQLAQKYLWHDTDAHRVLQEAGITLEPARFKREVSCIFVGEKGDRGCQHLV